MSAKHKKTSNGKLQVIAPDPARHRDELVDLTGKAFINYLYWLNHCRSGYIDQSHYDYNAAAIGIMDGKIVTHYGVWGFWMRIGSAKVKVAGIGAVATHGDYRKRGLMGQTIRAWKKKIVGPNYDLSLMFGLRGFYDPFGYVPAWSADQYRVSTKELSPLRGMRLKKFTPPGPPELAALYNRTHRGLTGTAVRPTYLRNPSGWEGWLWTDARGRIAGHIVVGEWKGHFQLMDYSGDPERILGALQKIAYRRRIAETEIPALHSRSPLAIELRRRYCSRNSDFAASGGPMICTLNLASTLNRIRAELHNRLKKSALAKWRGDLLVADAHEKVLLRIKPSGITTLDGAAGKTPHAIRGGDRIAQLLIGTTEPAETAKVGRFRLTGDGKKLMEVLFGPQEPSLEIWDHY